MTNKRAAILGGGVIGSGWVARFLLSGWDVDVYDPDPDAERKTGEVLSNARRSLPALYETAMPDEGTLRFHSDLAQAVANAQWIQEAIPEQLALKLDVFKQVQSACQADAIIASSTSGFKPSELQEGALNPEQIIVAHPFNPVYLLPLVELVGDAGQVEKARGILTELGMFPLHVRKEIDAHIADRFLEAVWREGLWLINDGIATTEEIDDAIRYGFGLRWAQMGLFETYRVAGGEAGMAHFIAQFGPCLKWPWTKLMDVPELSDELVETIASQSDQQSGMHSIRELERIRDDNLVAMMRSLKGRDWAAGELLLKQDERYRTDDIVSDEARPLRTLARVIPIDWTDYNGHMNESRYGQVFSDAADSVMRIIGADADYIESGLSYFTVETRVRYHEEACAGEHFVVDSIVDIGEGKKLRLLHKMYHSDGRLLASGEQMLLHVSLETRKSCPPTASVLSNKVRLAAAHAGLARD